jgi:hypothetical protein
MEPEHLRSTGKKTVREDAPTRPTANNPKVLRREGIRQGAWCKQGHSLSEESSETGQWEQVATIAVASE